MTYTKDIFSDIEKQIPIEKLGLSLPTVYALRNGNVRTLGELWDAFLHNNLIKFRNIGMVKYTEITKKLDQLQSESFRDDIKLKDALEQKSKQVEKQIQEYREAIQKLTQEQNVYKQKIENLTHSIEKGKDNGK